MNRPPHIDRAVQTLRRVAFTHPSTITGCELLEVSHHIARLEREAAKREAEHAAEVAVGVRAIYRLMALACLCEILIAILLCRWLS